MATKSANFSRNKGARAETKAKEILNEYLGEELFQRTPSSGALDARYLMKGDLFIPGEKNLYTIEVKSYKDSAISHLMLGKAPKIIEWAEQTERQAHQNRDNIPLLLFKHDRSKFYCASWVINGEAKYPNLHYTYEGYRLQVSLLSDFLTHEQPEFI